MAERKAEDGLPEHESFAFGLYNCADCGATIERGRKTLKFDTIWADYNETEVLYPGGRHSFHSECLDKFREQFAISRRQKRGRK